VSVSVRLPAPLNFYPVRYEVHFTGNSNVNFYTMILDYRRYFRLTRRISQILFFSLFIYFIGVAKHKNQRGAQQEMPKIMAVPFFKCRPPRDLALLKEMGD